MFIDRYKYMRIQGKALARNTMYAKGVFSMCWQLIQQDVMEDEDKELYIEIDSWFAENLPWPPQSSAASLSSAGSKQRTPMRC
ncbi:MAG: hypothetical protein K6F27_10350 [Ruminococcus sp.]|nr:hypothetical protein [Ruminococcus sp.]